jgi:hypothetical protein
MKKIKMFITSLIVLISTLFVASCNITQEKDLQLLRIEKIEENVNYSKRRNLKQEVDGYYISLRAVIKNSERASFIDMVVYNSQTNKTVVYNEGNGTYQCSSETVFEDEMWVTNIEFLFETQTEKVEDFYVEIKEIKFLKNNVDAKVDLNTEEVRKIEFTFSDEFLTRKIYQEPVTPFKFIDVMEIDVEKKEVSFSTEFVCQYQTEEDINSKEHIVVPETIRIKYYKNKELIEGDFKITGLYIKNSIPVKIYKLTLPNVKILGSDAYFINIEYKEGAEYCSLYWAVNIYIPSTCRELIFTEAGHVEYSEMHYNGTMEDFRKIKNAEEYIKAGKSTKIICTDGIIG